MSSGIQKGLWSPSPMGFNLTLLTSLVTKSHYRKWFTWNVLVSVNYKQTVVCMTKPPSQMVLFLGSPKHRQDQYSWAETSAKAQREQTESFVLIHFQWNENNTGCKIAVKGLSGLHKLEQSLGLLWLTHGTATIPRQSPSSEDTKVAEILSGSLCSHLCWGRAETSSPGCAQHISFLPSAPIQHTQPCSAQNITPWTNGDTVCQAFLSHREPSKLLWLPRGTQLSWGTDGVRWRARAMVQEQREQLVHFALSYRQQIFSLGKACKNWSGNSK